MKSKHVEEFNHDEWAAEYDGHVRNEDNPIRAGYSELLGWIAAAVNRAEAPDVLDVGAGTGNLSRQVKSPSRLVCLDISSEMLKRAEPKLAHLKNVSFAKADFLEFFENNIDRFDFIISSYALHHLTEPEKAHFISILPKALKPGGRIIIGDLMFENPGEKKKIQEQYLTDGNRELVDEINEEFFWDLDSAISNFHQAGFQTTIKRFSRLSWGVMAELPI